MTEKKQEYWLRLVQTNPQIAYSGSDNFKAELLVDVVMPPQYESEYKDGMSFLRDYTCDAKPTQYYYHLKFEATIFDDWEQPHVNWGFKGSGYSFLKPEQLEYMTKTHRAIERSIERLSDQYGYADTPGRSLLYFAQSIKAKKLLWMAQSPHQGYFHVTAADYQSHKIDKYLISDVDRTLENLKERCKLLAGKGTKPIDLYTTATEDYDHSSTQTLQMLQEEYRGKQLRKVRIQPECYKWQTDRYGSGLHLILTVEDFQNWNHPACRDIKAIEQPVEQPVEAVTQ